MAKLLLFCFDVIGEAMAGPAIRYWEFAKALSQRHQVVLMTPNKPDIKADSFVLKCWKQTSLENEIANVDLIITQKISYKISWYAKKYGVKLILDAYDPMPLENLEIFKNNEMNFRTRQNEKIVNSFLFDFQIADAILCANSRQRDLWIGFLMSLKRILPQTYDQDSSLNNFIKIIPFGLPSTPPKKGNSGLKQLFQLKENDKVILWGGGIWNWFDPLTLIETMKGLYDSRPDIKLIFMGLRHPNDQIPEMKMASTAFNLSKDYHLLNRTVFFNFGWVPYQERQNFLLDADIGISIHSDHLETRYAFRTRLLDYLWASLPIIATQGDSFAELIEKQHLGIIVPFQDPSAIAQAIKTLLDKPEHIQKIKNNIAQITPSFYWETLIQPLQNLIDHLVMQPKETRSFEYLKKVIFSLSQRGFKEIMRYLPT